MAAGLYPGIDFRSNTVGAAIASTTTETDLFEVDPNYGKGYFEPGKMLRIKVWGEYSTTGTPTIIFRVRGSSGGVSGSTLTTLGTLTTGSGVANQLFVVEAIVMCKTTGATGAFHTFGEARIWAASSLTPTLAGSVTPATSVALDTTATQAFSVTQQWSANSSSNTMTRVGYIVESIG